MSYCSRRTFGRFSSSSRKPASEARLPMILRTSTPFRCDKLLNPASVIRVPQSESSENGSMASISGITSSSDLSVIGPWGKTPDLIFVTAPKELKYVPKPSSRNLKIAFRFSAGSRTSCPHTEHCVAFSAIGPQQNGHGRSLSRNGFRLCVAISTICCLTAIPNGRSFGSLRLSLRQHRPCQVFGGRFWRHGFGVRR
jgi:hypothetical protein